MNQPTAGSPQHNNFGGAIALLVVGAFGSALMGGLFGFMVAGALIGILFTRAAWARIVTLVIVGYVGAVGLLVSLFARGNVSFAGFVAALIAMAIFWLLLRPGMSQFFSAGAAPAGRVVPVAPRPGALPHLHQNPASVPVAAPRVPAISPSSAGSTQEQWDRLQQQLRADRAQEEREAAAVESVERDSGTSYPWLTTIVAVLIYAHAAAVGGDLGRVTLLLVIPGFIAAMLRWIHPQGFLLGVLVLSGFLMVRPEWKIVSPQIGVLLQHHCPMVCATAALLLYLIAMCASGLDDACETVA